MKDSSDFEIHDFYIEDDTPTVKERYASMAGKDVSLDYFLCCCDEEERTVKALVDDGYTLPSAPVAVATRSSGELAGEQKEQELSELIDGVVQWHASNQPELTRTASLDHEALATLLTPLICLCLDTTLILRAKLGQLPQRASGTAEQPESWQAVDASYNKHFGKNASFYIAYLDWCFRKPTKVEYDLGSLPPVGRYALMLRRLLGRRPSGDRPGGRGPSRGEGRGGRPDRGPDRPRQDGPRPARGEDRSSARPPRGEDRGNARPPRGDDRSHGPRPSRGEDRSGGRQNSTDEKQKEAITEVETALGRLEVESVDSVTLEPRNSFIRRLQHRHAVEKGYKSNSVGEGRSRAVQVSR